VRDAVEEIGGSIQRIHDPARLGGIALARAALLAKEAPVGPGPLQFLVERLFRLAIGLADEVRRPLAADLQLLNLVEIAPQLRRRFAGGALHDGDQA
jgi:hypothetical protein